MALLPAVLAGGLEHREARQVLRGTRRLGVGDLVHRGHAGQDVAVAGEERCLVALAVRGVELRRVVQHAGQDRALAQAELVGVDPEVRLGGGLDAVRPTTEVDGVEVARQDLLLALLLLQLQRQDRLVHLAGDRPLLGQVEDLHVLLGDRRGALRRTAAGVVERRADDALGIDAAVGPEGPVLGGDHGVLQLLRHVAVGDDLAVLRGVLPELGLAVVVVDERGLGLEVLVRVRDRGGLVEVDEPTGQQQRADDGHDQEPLQGAPQSPPGRSRLARLARDGGACGPALGTHGLLQMCVGGSVHTTAPASAPGRRLDEGTGPDHRRRKRGTCARDISVR